MRWPRRTAVLTACLVASLTTAVVAQGVPLTRERGFTVLSPVDGAAIADAFLLRWSAWGSRTSYAVVVDAAIPRPGALVTASDRVLTVQGTSVQLSLGRAASGSPAARAFHTVTVLALDDAGRRVGSSAAVVHVRNAS